jgi:hypothetical protein
MATRGTIALEFADGTIGMVYSHWDNYLEGTGKILQEHYMDPFKVRQLIDEGSVSSLRPDIGTVHLFDNPFRWDSPQHEAFKATYGNMTTFYGRDRGDTDTSATRFRDFADYEANGDWQEYNYILRNIGGKPVWFVNGEFLSHALEHGLEDDEVPEWSTTY